jgi:hypothetical protein
MGAVMKAAFGSSKTRWRPQGALPSRGPPKFRLFVILLTPPSSENSLGKGQLEEARSAKKFDALLNLTGANTANREHFPRNLCYLYFLLLNSS